MKPLWILLLLLPVLATAETHVLARVPLSGPHAMLRIARTGIPLDDGVQRTPEGLVLVLSESEMARLLAAGFRPEILRADLESYYASRLQTPGQAPLSTTQMGGFYTFAEVLQKLQSYRQRYKNLVSAPIQIGRSLEGRPIFAVKISDHPGLDEQDEPEVLFTALHHAREPESLSCLLYFMEHLLQGYGKVPEVTYLVDHRQLWFVPVVNPDGYVYNELTNPSGGGLWRKNRRSNANGSYGVDLNRNYGYMWGFDDFGSSSLGEDETYRGASAFSEPETQAIKNFVEKHNFVTVLNYHSFHNALIFPWGYQNAPTPHQRIFRDLSHYMTRLNHYLTGTSFQVLQYITNGEACDWMYGSSPLKDRTLAMVTEAGGQLDGFWPAPERIVPIARENYESSLSLAWAAGGYPVVWEWKTADASAATNGMVQPGFTYSLILTMRNLGIREGLKDITVSVTSPTTAAIVRPSTASFGDVDPLKIRKRGDIRIQISARAKINQQIPLVLWFESGGIRLRKETLKLTVLQNTP